MGQAMFWVVVVVTVLIAGFQRWSWEERQQDELRRARDVQP